MIILGIDPGTSRVGFGVIKNEHGELALLDAGLLTINRGGAEALRDIKAHTDRLLKKFKPGLMAIEKLFFSKNQKTGIAVSEARGVILLAALEQRVAIREYAPSEVKAGIAGYGSADKQAVQKMVRLILKKPGLRVIDDASDALALAILAAGRRPA